MKDPKSSTAAGRPEAKIGSSSVAQTKEADRADENDANAYERGADAGRKGDAQQGNPYPDGSHAAKSFEHGQLDAQKVRSSDKPPGR